MTSQLASAPPPGADIASVLVPTDLSAESRKALRYGAALARKFGAAAEDQMREFAAAGEFVGVEFDTHVRAGAAAEQICDYAQTEKIDLIVTSTHGRTGLLHVLIGSVAEHVVRYAHCPVLVVPEPGQLNSQK